MSTRRILHAILVILAGPIWVVSCLVFGLSVLLVLAADKVWPDADRGNCWSFVMPRFLREGGYVCIRAARHNARLLGLPIPHAIWLRDMPTGAWLEQTRPTTRQSGFWLVLLAFYFHYRVVMTERTGDA